MRKCFSVTPRVVVFVAASNILNTVYEVIRGMNINQFSIIKRYIYFLLDNAGVPRAKLNMREIKAHADSIN